MSRRSGPLLRGMDVAVHNDHFGPAGRQRLVRDAAASEAGFGRGVDVSTTGRLPGAPGSDRRWQDILLWMIHIETSAISDGDGDLSLPFGASLVG